MTEKKDPRGGPRENAGRKKQFDEPLKAVSVRLPFSEWEKVMKKGGAAWARDVLIKAANKEK